MKKIIKIGFISLLVLTMFIFVSFDAMGADFVIVTGTGTLSGNETLYAEYLLNNSIYNFTSYQVVDDDWTNLTSDYTPDLYIVVSSTVAGTLSNKLRTVEIGVLSMDPGAWETNILDLCNSVGSSSRTDLSVINDTHPITNFTTTGTKTFSTSSIILNRCQGTAGSGVTNLTVTPTTTFQNFMAYDFNDTLIGGSTVKARRTAHGYDANNFYAWTEFAKNLSIYSTIWTANISLISSPSTPTTTFNGLVTNITFDNASEPFKDYTGLHNFTTNGLVSQIENNKCKWYGCGNFSVTDGSDYLNTTTNFALEDGIAISMWLNLDTHPTGASSQSYLMITDSGNTPNLKWIQEGDFGINPQFNAELGQAGGIPGESYGTPAEIWTHYFIMYDENRLYTYIDGNLIVNGSNPYGNLNYSIGDLFYIGVGLFNIDTHGYIDELLIWNRSNFTTSEIQSIYDSKRLGTPPEIDIYIKSIKYELPINYSNNNSLDIGNLMEVNITIANAGTQNSANFDYNFTLENTNICSNNININANSETEIQCSFTTSYGFKFGNVTIDLTDNNTENNYQQVYIPLLDRPYTLFNYTDWVNELNPYCSNSSNLVASNSCGWIKSFTSDNFNNAWTGENVDPRGKKGRENAMTCMANGYNYTKTQCIYARNHLFGWGNRTVTTYNNVQAIHELSHVGYIYDIMFKNLTKEENELITQQYHDICQYITNLDNVRPDLDNEDKINGGNGFGFGSGMGGFCYSILGSYKENPTLIQEHSQQYWGENLVDEWMARENSYLGGYKNDSYAQYQEGWNYKQYSQFHLVENWLFEKRMGFNYLNDYQNALCSMARENIYQILDYSYNGLTLRNDKNNNFRVLQRGDSYSYQIMSDGSFINWDIVLYQAYLCDDINVKKSILWLREKALNTTDGRFTYPSPYLYKYIEADAGSLQNPEGINNKFVYDNANDIFMIRDGFNYINDTVFQIDGGDERAGGHSQAQGYYLYALGEPFIDYEQVPLEDDVRAETWKNAVSLQNTSQTVEGTGGTYSQTCGNSPLNQYYGMLDCDVALFSVDYPNFRRFPLTYGGDLEDYIGSDDAYFGGVYDWKPYFNATKPVENYFIKFGDIVAKRTVVNGNLQGEGVYHNFINLYNETTETRDGTTFVFNRSNKKMKTKLVYDNTSNMILGGGLTGLRASNTKTGSATLNVWYRRNYYYTPDNNADFIFSHDWYLDNNNETIQSINYLNDYGLSHGNDRILFDNSGDNYMYNLGYNATGWGMAFKTNEMEIGAFNTTMIKNGTMTLFSSNIPVSVHFKKGTNDDLKMTINTMERDGYIDYPQTATVTVDISDLINNTGDFNITDSEGTQIVPSSNTSHTVTFDAISTQNSDYYLIKGGAAVEITTTTTTTTTTSTVATTTLADQDCNSLLNNFEGNYYGVVSAIALFLIVVMAVFVLLIIKSKDVNTNYYYDLLKAGGLLFIIVSVISIIVIKVITGGC